MLLIFGFTTLLLAQHTGRDQAQLEIQRGDRLMNFGDWKGALDAYSNAIVFDGSYATAYMKRATVYERIGAHKKAVQDYDMAMAINPNSEYIYDNMAKLRMLAVDYKGALKDINSAISEDPNNSAFLNARIDNLIALSQYRIALRQIEILDEKDQPKEEMYERKAIIHLFLQDEVNFGIYIDSLLMLNPQSAVGLDLKGVHLLKQQDYVQAIEAFSNAIEADSTFALAYYNRGVAHRYSGNAAQALADLNKSIAIRQDIPNVFFMRALMENDQGDLNSALSDYQRAISIDGTYADAIFNKAYTLKALGDYTSAFKEAEKIAALESDSPQNWNLKGNMQVLFGDYEEAIRSYTRAINSSQNYSEAYYNRGIAKIMDMQINDGCMDLQQSASLGYERAQTKLAQFCR